MKYDVEVYWRWNRIAAYNDASSFIDEQKEK